MPAVSPNSSNPISSVALDASNNNVNAMLSGYKWGGIVGTPVTVYYSFPTSNNAAFWSQDPEQYGYIGDETESLLAFSAAQQIAATSALQQWANVANITFQKVTETTSAVGDIRFGNTSPGFGQMRGADSVSGGDFGYAWTLRETSPGVGSPDSGDIWLNRIQPVSTGNNYTAGAAGYHTVLHEIGHALGIDHSFAEITEENPADLGVQTGRDFYQYSVMSYDSYDTGSLSDSDYGYNEYYPTTLMLLDIQAIQHLYGANMTYRTGNDTYVFNSATKYLQTIWDAGGTDTIQYSSAVGGVINLNQGEFSQLGKSYKVGQNPDPLPQFNFAGVIQTDTVGIAYGAVIENAIGGSGNDTLIGNSVNNVLDGGAGIDTLEGGAGDDTYVIDNIADIVNDTGGDANDTLKSNITLNLSTQAGKYTGIELVVLNGAAALNLTGDSNNNLLKGNDGANIIDGNGGEDSMNGGKGADTYVVNSANDTVTEDLTLAQGGGVDLVKSELDHILGANLDNLTLTGANNINGTGNALANIIIGNAGNNQLSGGAANDTLTGNAGSDTLNGDEGNDILQGGEGDDTLTGGAGVDALTGGKGNDTYYIDITRNTALATAVLALQDTVSELANPLNSTVEGIDTIVLTNLTGNAGVLGSAGAPIDTSNITNATTLTVNANVENFDASQTGSTKLNITGNALANIITGNDAANYLLDAAGGTDSLSGGAGNDTLDGGAGIDTLEGGAGNDTYFIDLKTGLPADTIVIDSTTFQDIVLESGGDSDDIVKLRGNATLTNPGIVSLSYFAGVEHVDASATGITKLGLTGTDANNFLVGNAAANVIYGLAGNDTLDGGAGLDNMAGGNGDDTYYVDVLGDITDESATDGTDTVIAKIAAGATYTLGTNLEHLTAFAGSVSMNLTGNNNANRLTGNAGANILDGGVGADNLVGGNGGDTYIVDNFSDVVTETNALATGGIDLVKSSVDFTLGNNIENLTLTESVDFLLATGNSLANTIIGNSNINYIQGMGGKDTLIGGKGSDIYYIDLIRTSALPTSAIGLQDTVTELANPLNSTIEGIDTIVLTNRTGALSDTPIDVSNVTTATTLTINANVENFDASLTGAIKLNLTGSATDNILTGNAADNVLLGLAGVDQLFGGDGNDTLDGGLGNDDLVGGYGDDTYIVDLITPFTQITYTIQGDAFTAGNLQDTVLENPPAGNDTLKIRGTFSNTSVLNINMLVGGPLFFNVEGLDISLTGAAKINLTGDSADNNLVGNSAANTIIGNDGNDTLDGGAWADNLIGGDGNDTYVVDNIADIVNEAGTGNDTIRSSIAINLNSTISTTNLALKYANIEHVTLTGAAAVNVTGNVVANILNGNDGANIIDGGAGNDTMSGGKGADTYIVDSEFDEVSELFTQAQGSGIDTVKSSANNFTLAANVENLTLTDHINLNGGTTNINGTGNELANIIIGNAGANRLRGEAGVDTLVGGLGNDYYIVNLKQIGLNAAAYLVLEDIVTEQNVITAGYDTIELVGIFNTLSKASTIKMGLGIEVLDARQTDTTMINITGNELNNIIYSSSIANNIHYGGLGDDRIFDYQGDDYLNGEEGNDYLGGGDGNDTVDGGLGVDLMYGDGGNDTYIIDNIDDFANEEENEDLNDTVIYKVNAHATQVSIINLGVDNQNSIFLAAPTNGVTSASLNLTQIESLTVTGTGRYHLVGNTQSNTLIGNAGNNLIAGGLGNDTLTGGAGNDVFVIDAVGTNNFDVITDFVSGIDNIKLSDPKFDIVFNPGFTSDRLLISTGGNVLVQNPSNYLVYNKTTGELWFSRDANGTIDIDGNGIDAPELIAKFVPNTTLQWMDFFNITLRGTLGNDVLRGGRGDDYIEEQYFGDVNSGNDSAYGGDGDDLIRAGTGNDYIEGGTGNDTIYAGIEGAQYSPSYGIYPDNDTVYGGDGNDSIYGGVNGIDVLDGGNGDDLLNGSSNTLNAVKLIGGLGNDTLYGGQGNDTLIGGAGNDSINANGSAGNDNIDAGDGDDTIWGGASSTILGGNGNDTLYGIGNGGAGDDTYHLNNYSLIADTSGIDTVISYDSFTTLYTLGSTIENLIIKNANNVTVIGNSFNNILTSEAIGNATLSGEGGNDKITGYLGNDTINGGAGNDTIIGSRGVDILTGGLGADRFEYHAQEDSMPTFASDTIVDFSRAQLDKIDLSLMDADATTAGVNETFTFIGNVAFSGVAGQLRFDSASNSVYGDIDGNSTADIQITLTGVTSMLASDFIL